MASLLTKTLPSTVDVGGFSIPIETDWRTWVKVWEVRESRKEGWKRAFVILSLVFTDPNALQVASENVDEALEKAIAFLDRTLGDSTPPRPPTKREKQLAGKRLFDWEWDSARIAADFTREYGIDLTDPYTKMHWWRFMSLFNGLSDTSSTMEAISIRAADLDAKGMSKEQKKHLRERKAALMLPARDREEAARNFELRGC